MRDDHESWAARPGVLGDRFAQALKFAFDTHSVHRRKGSGVPYVAHLFGVCSLVLEDGGSEDEAIGALLHDAAEDCGGGPMLDKIRAKFGDDVADIVAGCTDTMEEPKPDWRPRKERYIEHLKWQSESVLRVSLADKLFNARAILRDYLELREDLWARFNTGGTGQLWYYRELADRFNEILPKRGMSVRMALELHKVVSELESVALTGDGYVGGREWSGLVHPHADDRWIDESRHEGEEYRALKVSLPEQLPQTISVGGRQWERLAGSHVTLFEARAVKRMLGEGDHTELIARLAEMVSAASRPRRSGEPWLEVTRIGPPWRVAETDDRRSLVVVAEVKDLHDLYDKLSEEAGCRIPAPPLHATVYTEPGNKGIGITLPSEWGALTRPLTACERGELEEQLTAGRSSARQSQTST
jgi:GTP pyrophosphokinase